MPLRAQSLLELGAGRWPHPVAAAAQALAYHLYCSQSLLATDPPLSALRRPHQRYRRAGRRALREQKSATAHCSDQVPNHVTWMAVSALVSLGLDLKVDLVVNAAQLDVRALFR